MQITSEQVVHMAQLARLSLSPDEIEKFAHEFSDILNYVESLNEVAIDDIAPMTGATKITNSTRKDEVTRESGGAIRDEFISRAPEHTQDYIETISPFKES